MTRELRICHLCKAEDLGDEFHYLIKRGYFSENRKTCMKMIIF